MLAAAESVVGKPYVYGTNGPDELDCSGFVCYSLRSAGLNIRLMSSAKYAEVDDWTLIEDANGLRPGDLVFFRSDASSDISHSGIYLGEGRMIHAAPSIGGVGYSTMETGYYARNFVLERRVF